MTIRSLRVLVLAPIVFMHPADLFGQNTVVSWSALDMGFASSASATTTVHSIAGQMFAGSFGSANTMIASGFIADTLFRTRITSVVEPGRVPTEHTLQQNYPNPFNPTTTIRYGLPQRSHVTLKVYNTLGQQVAMLQNGEQESGYHEVKFDAGNLASGVYFYRIQAGDFAETKRLLLTR